jgi:hypothetical protein
VYYPTFTETEVDPASFRNSFQSHEEWNKALILFAELRRSLRALGESRLSRKADYFFRVWHRRRLFHRWKLKRIWALLVITIGAVIYDKWLPQALATPHTRFLDFWYYSFKVFFAQGLAGDFQTAILMLVQVGEFLTGLVLVALLIGSIARKLSP